MPLHQVRCDLKSGCGKHDPSSKVLDNALKTAGPLEENGRQRRKHGCSDGNEAIEQSCLHALAFSCRRSSTQL